MTTIFIDGQAGTTGLEIANRLDARQDIELLRVDDGVRKDPGRRGEAIRAADIAVLCLPDDAARESVALAQGQTRILDASTAHRTDDGWVYGLPELTRGQRKQIAQAQLVSNPGCYAQGLILLLRPLIDAELLPEDLGVHVHAISGYSGGGKGLIDRYAALPATERFRWATRPYALDLHHKHVAEMRRFSGLAQEPMFTPIVADFYKGMLVQVPLFTSEFASEFVGTANVIERVVNALQSAYSGEPCVRVWPDASCGLEDGFLDPTGCNDTNRVDLMVFGHESQILLSARLDNLGKGASGAAVQNLNVMMGVDELTGLEL